jgi:hypothetical protein
MMLADFRIDQFDEMRLEALVRAFPIRKFAGQGSAPNSPERGAAGS